MKNDAMIFWERVDNLVKSKRITLKQLCADYGLVYGTIMQNKARKILPSLLITKGLSKALNKSLDYLVTGEEYKDAFYKQMEDNIQTKFLYSKLLKCDEHQLALIHSMLESWGFAEDERKKGLA